MPVRRSSTDSLFRPFTRALTLALLAAAPLAAQGTPLTGAARWADSARVTIERAVVTHDSAGLVAAGALLDKALGAFPNDPLLLHYRAYGLYREAQFGPTEEMAKGTEAALLRAIELLKRSAAARPLPETQALLSSCLGTLAGTGMMAGMRYGPGASEAGESARALGPRNPRVLLLAAIGAWFTPSMWGGGKDKGYALMQQAIAAFGSDAPAAPLPAWGRAEAYAWLGQMERDRGNAAQARAAYERALALEPQYRWVRDELLPRLSTR